MLRVTKQYLKRKFPGNFAMHMLIDYIPFPADAYLYVAYASDAAGTGWSLEPSDALKYISFLVSDIPLAPVESDFAEVTWIKYIGENGTGTAHNPVTIDPGSTAYLSITEAQVLSINTSNIGGGGSDGLIREIPAGAINGSNVTFTLSHVPDPDSLELILNGSLLQRGVAYTIIGNTITLTLPFYLNAPDWLYAIYRPLVTYTWVRQEIPSGVMDGVNDTFVLSAPATKVELWLNGNMLREGVEFTFSGDTIKIIAIHLIPNSASGDWMRTNFEKIAA